MDAELLRLVEQRLIDSGNADEEWAMLVLGACQGAESLDAVLGGETRRRRGKTAAPPKPPTTDEQPGAYLRSITVEGFRGVGPRKTLELTPGPGLTLVIGRNGSGKSSFAEALEILLTGSNWRWAYRSAIWKDGWRNLHHPSPSEVSSDLAVEGKQGGTTITRTWADGAELDQGEVDTDLDALGWTSALDEFRPFLSYSELGTVFEMPTRLHDGLARILGLSDLDLAEGLLRDSRLARETRIKQVKGSLTPLVSELEALEDERARRAVAAVGGRKWDLEALRRVVADDDGTGGPTDTLAILRGLATLETPSAAEAKRLADLLRDVSKRVDKLAETDSQRVADLSALLRDALDFHEDHGDNDCPVCGNPKALDGKWREKALDRLEDLEARNSEWDSAAGDSEAAIREVERLLVRPPSVLRSASEAGIDVGAVPATWAKLITAPEGADLRKLARHVESAARELEDEAIEVRLNAQAELDRRQDVWRPLAIRLAAWLASAEETTTDSDAVVNLKAAEKWLKEASASIRADRFEPIAAEAIKNWEELRQQSSVGVERIALEGTGARRRVTVDVEIDGVGGAALGVMSQGELHAIALGMFLPRATLPESPFRFVVIDDPVQSMDPARVDGLARVLARTAQARQVLVFTHDDRLPEATRRLGIDATIIEVTRHEDSVIELRESLDPVRRNLEDADVLVRTKSFPVEVAQEVVPAFCRSAIEAAAIEVVRRRRIGRGEEHGAVERLLAESKTTNQLLSLALWDEAGRGGDVMRSVSQRWGDDLGDALGTAIRGAHAGYRGSLDVLVRDTRRLCTKVGELP